MPVYFLRITVFIIAILSLWGCSQSAEKRSIKPSEATVEFPISIRDSLPEKIKKFEELKDDTLRLAYLIRLSDSNSIYRKEILSHVIANSAQRSRWPYRIIAYCKGGSDFARRNLHDSARHYFEKGIQFCEINKIETHQAAKLYNEYGLYFTRKTDFANGLKYINKAIQIAEKCKSTMHMLLLCELGQIYQSITKPQKASACFLEASDHAFKTKNYSLQIYALNSLGDLYRVLEKPDSAIYFHEQALNVNEYWHHNRNEPWAITSLGKAYAMKNDFQKAEKYFEAILNDARSRAVNDLAAQAYLNLAFCYYRQGNLSNAEQNAYKGYQLSLKHPDLDLRSALAGLLSDIYIDRKKFDKALDYYKIQSTLNDSIENVTQVKKIAEEEFRQKEEGLIGKIEKNIEQLKLQKEKGKQEAKRQNLIIVSVSALLFMALIFAFFIYRSLQRNKKQKEIIANQKVEVEKQKEIIERKNFEMVSSIQYAKNIQKTLLTNREFINEHIRENFILYKPKDIVSGDFYWATKHSGKFFLAVCDSTGHGVPGAFMSLLNIGFLSEAINEKGLIDPAAIFNYVRNRLKHSISKENQQDGFDGILMCIDTTKKQVQYVAANNSPVLLRGGICTILPYDKMPVGIGPKSETFTTHCIDIVPGDVVYLYTDGFEDQFGGPEGKKFRSKNLHDLFLQHSHFSLQNQQELLEKTFEEWKTHLGKNGKTVYEQIDDVCIVGMKII